MEFISFEIPNVNEFIRRLSTIEQELDEKVTQSLENGARAVADEQKRIISSKSDTLPNYITIKADKTKRGNKYYRIGYIGADTVDKWLHGAVLEFGRPGKRGRGTIKQTRHGREVDVRNGYIPEYSHIRRAFDLHGESIAESVKTAFDQIVSRMEGDLNGHS